MSSMTHNEALEFIATGKLPEDFKDRVEAFLEFEDCTNCGNVRCMHFVMRDWYAPDFDTCDGWCCPFCSDMKDSKWIQQQEPKTTS